MTVYGVPQSPDEKPRFFYGYIVVALAFLIMTAMWSTYYAFGVFFKPMSGEFGWTRAMTSGAFSLSTIVRGLLGILMGGLNDRLGPRIVMALCGFLLGIGYLLVSNINAIWQLYLFYGVLVGIGMSGAWVPLLSTVARWFVARRSMMTSIVLIGTSIGALMAPPVANWLISTYDWRISYIVMGSLVLVFVVLLAQFLRRDPAKMGQAPYDERKGVEQGLSPETAGFSLREAVDTRQFWTIFAMLFCFGFAMFTVMVHIVPYTTDLGISATSAANVMATVGGVAILGRVVLGSAADKIGNRRVYIIGFILMALALFWLASATQLWMLYPFAVVFGFAFGGTGPLQSPMLAGLFGLSSHGLIFGVSNVGFTVGAALGPFLAGYIFDVTGSYQMAFLLSAVASIIGIVLSVLLRPIKGEPGQDKVIVPL